MKVDNMRSKLMTSLLVTVLSLTAAPFAVDHIANLKNVAEKWTRNTFLNGFITVPADEREGAPVGTEEPLTSSRGALSSTEDFRWSGRLAAGRTIEIKGVNGAVRAEPSASNEVEVTAIKHSRRSDPKDVEIRVVEHEGGVTICAVYPSGDPSHPNVCAPDDGGYMNVQNNDVYVDFKVRVPQGVRFRPRTVNGEVQAEGLGGDVDAKTVNGDISISTAGIARAKTVNGSIKAAIRTARWSSPLEFKTVNGGITLDLPAEISAEVRAQTLNGDISSAFEVSVTGSRSRRHLTGTIGGGGSQISIKTVNGSIRLNRAS
jgi:hypothetical protein